jgi:1,4-alpha-glucan branching enzyme
VGFVCAYTVLRAPSGPTSGMGANLLPQGAGASFRLWAPNASAVDLLLQPNASTPAVSVPLQMDARGSEYFSADISGVKAGDYYRFQITNNGIPPNNPGGLFERIDPDARDIDNPDAASPAIVADPTFGFAAFVAPSLANCVIYQAHIGSFAGLNDAFAGAVTKMTASFATLLTRPGRTCSTESSTMYAI